MHLAGDIAHLLAAAGWIGALVVFWIMLVRPIPSVSGQTALCTSLAGFSGVGTMLVAVTRVFLGGLVLDFCVRYSAEDARESGFDVVVVEDACAAIDLAGSAAQARAMFAALGIKLASETRTSGGR